MIVGETREKGSAVLERGERAFTGTSAVCSGDCHTDSRKLEGFWCFTFLLVGTIKAPLARHPWLPYNLEPCYTSAKTRDEEADTPLCNAQPTPLAELVKSLAGLHQAQHQALIDMKLEQEDRFRLLVQARMKISGSSGARLAGRTTPSQPHRSPTSRWWRLVHTMIWRPLWISSRRQQRRAAVRAPIGWCAWSHCWRGKRRWQPNSYLPPGLRWSKAGHPATRRPKPEQHRQRFRSVELGDNGRPFVIAQQLRDYCRKWLMAEPRDVEGVINLVVLEQFIARLPRRTAEWVQCHRPTSLTQAIQLVEDHLVVPWGRRAPD